MRRVFVAFVGLAIGACLQADLAPCGDLLCPSDTVCAPDGRCLPPALLEQCTGIADGTACDVGDGIEGRCANGVCERASCGDQFVDTALNEECDGGPAAQCVDFGFDLGRAGCDACSIDTSTCVKFGWVRTDFVSSEKLWSDGTITAFTTFAPHGLVVRGGGFAVESTERHLDVDGGGNRVFAIAQTGELVEAMGTTLVSHGTLPAAGPPIDLAVAEDGTAFVLGADCRVFSFDGAWAEIATSIANDQCALLAVQGAGATRQIAVAAPTGPVWLDNGGGFVELQPSPGTVAVLELDGPLLWVGGTAGLEYTSLTAPGTFTQRIAGHTISSIAFIGQSIYASTAAGLVLRRFGKGTEILRGPTGGRVIDDGVGGLYMYRGPIYRFTGTSYSELVGPPIDVIEDQLSGATLLRGGELVVISANNLFELDVATGDWRATPNSLPSSLRGVSGFGLAVSVVTHDDDDNSIVARAPSASGAFVVIPSSNAVKDAVWVANASTTFVVGASGAGAAANTSAGWIGEITAGVIDELVLPASLGACRLFAVDGQGADGALHAIAAGRCDGRGVVLERVAFRDWREIYRSPSIDGGFRAVARIPSNATGYMIFAAGEGGAAWFDGAWHSDPTVVGGTLSGTSADDVWLSGALTNVQHFDGASWSVVATAALGQITVLARPGDVLFPGGAPGHVQLIRDRDIVPP